MINGIRASVGLGALTWDDGLGDIAAARCRQLMDDFSHNGMTAPEICAMGAPDASSVVSSWQASSAHYAQMVYEATPVAQSLTAMMAMAVIIGAPRLVDK